MEEARSKFFEDKGIAIKKLAKQGILFVVSRQEIDYKSPAFYADILHIDTRVTRVWRVKLEFEYEIKNQNNQIVCTARTVMACVNSNFKPQATPRRDAQKVSEIK